ncbi:protein of unknown function [Salinimicrobium catena]|uniref:DUF4296 domain-containing protein n=1 Tax=Salinimicrobium catena TaxID=390640 RepID=A0A1H5JKL7_9FLAO|nr:DUF4296 domain-containing protein [Salinimicrobium catena]SDK88518.1 protein of unknown function [Salinimicrobium catena]SEE53113.1 protein of unknown function [Salinimicrobium catena]
MRLLYALLIMALFAGCQDIQKTPKPEDLISKDKMVDVLTEISLLHGARSYNVNLLEEKGIDPNKYIYEKYDIDSLQLVKSNDYYAANYRDYQDIYNNVKERLEALKVEYDTIRVREERRKDSLRKLERDTLLEDSIRKPERDSLLQDSIRRPRKDSLLLKKFRRGDKQLPVPMSRRDSIR